VIDVIKLLVFAHAAEDLVVHEVDVPSLLVGPAVVVVLDHESSIGGC
jgi:hypothetical protein